MTTSESAFVFNLGRLWQEVISEHWDTVYYLYSFIQEITDPSLLKKYSRQLKALKSAIENESSEKIDNALGRILKW